MIGINAAKYNEVACGFHVRNSKSKCATGLGWRVPTFLLRFHLQRSEDGVFMSPSGRERPESLLLLDDQLQVNRIFSLNLLALQYLIRNINAFRANLIR